MRVRPLWPVRGHLAPVLLAKEAATEGFARSKTDSYSSLPFSEFSSGLTFRTSLCDHEAGDSLASYSLEISLVKCNNVPHSLLSMKVQASGCHLPRFKDFWNLLASSSDITLPSIVLGVNT